MDLQKVFEKFEDEYVEFKKVENKLSERPDLHAFLLLDSILPSDRYIVDASEHDEIYLSVDCEELAKVITEDQVRDLVRAGIRFNGEYLAMFV